MHYTLRTTGCVLLLALAAARTPTAEPGATWLDRLNFYRATASLPPVAEEPRLSGDVLQHARYMVRHDIIEHSQNIRRRGATAAGAIAAASSNLAGSTRSDEPDTWAVDTWMQAPFHALGILDPAVTHVGFGIHRAPGGRIQTAAGLDIMRGRVATPVPVTFPILWPANGASVPLVAHQSEYPDPLSSCPGYAAPSGLPLIVQLGRGHKVPQVLGSFISDGSTPLEHCVFDESTYVNRDRAEQSLGRRILATRDAIVLIPRRPLRHGATYHVILEVAGHHRIGWSFDVGVSGSAGVPQVHRGPSGSGSAGADRVHRGPSGS